MVLFGRPYTDGESLARLLESCVAHAGWVHLSKNVATLVIAVAILHKWGQIRFALPAVAMAPVGNAWVAAQGSAVVGASGGTFALLGSASVFAFRQYPRATVIAVSWMVTYQAVVTGFPVAHVHLMAFTVGAIYTLVWD